MDHPVRRDLLVEDRRDVHPVRLAADAWVGRGADHLGDPAADLAKARDSPWGADHDFLLARGASAVDQDALLHPELLPQDERRVAVRAHPVAREAGSLDRQDESAGPKALWGELAAQQEHSGRATSAQEPLAAAAGLAKKRAEQPQPQELKAKLQVRQAWLARELAGQAEPLQESQPVLSRVPEVSPWLQAWLAQRWAARLPMQLEPPTEQLAVLPVALLELAPRARAARQGASALPWQPLP